MLQDFDEFLAEGTGFQAWHRVDPPRRLTESERAVIEALLRHDFPGAGELRRQIPTLRVHYEGASNSASLKMSPVRDPSNAAPVKARVPVEGWGMDAEGRESWVLLHVISGFIGELQVLSRSESPVALPLPQSLVVY